MQVISWGNKGKFSKKMRRWKIRILFLGPSGKNELYWKLWFQSQAFKNN